MVMLIIFDISVCCMGLLADMHLVVAIIVIHTRGFCMILLAGDLLRRAPIIIDVRGFQSAVGFYSFRF